jgi:predicted DNA-binding transcriptional regulator AlpA
MSVETQTGGPVPQDVVPLVVDIKSLSKLLQRSVPSLRRDEAHGRLPAGIRIGRSKRWRVDTIEAWLKAGAPSIASELTPS